MSERDSYGRLTAVNELTIERLLPGPIDRVWAYLTTSELRRQWLARGEMELKEGAPFTLTWRNDEITADPGTRPEGASEEHSLDSTIVAVEAPHRLVFTWGDGDVTFRLEEQGQDVLLTVIHRKVTTRGMLTSVSAGWHSHLDILAEKLRGEEPGSFWDKWTALKAEYEARLPAEAPAADAAE